jgi:GT2 family glycosyltransferase
MKVGIVLINYKDYAVRFLHDSAASLRKVNFPEGEVNFFVVDNVTTPETQKQIKDIFPECEIIPSENNGYGLANNLGAARAFETGCDFVCFVNMDTAFQADFLSEMLKVYQSDPQIGLVQARLMIFEEPAKINSVGNIIHFLGFGFGGGYKFEYIERPTIEDIDYPSGAATLVSKEVFEKIGPFTEDFFMYHDDLELGIKSKLAGYRNVVANRAVVFHKYEFSRSITKYFWMERNRFAVLLMVYKISTLIVIFPAWFIMEIGQFFFAVKGGWYREKLKVYRWFLSGSNWKKIFVWRRKTQALRTITDRELTKNFSGRVEFQEAEMQNWVLKYIANPFFNAYWQVLKRIMFW